VTQRALSRINLNCATGSTTAYNTTRVFEQWSIFSPAIADRDATAHVPQAPLSPILLTASATPHFLRSSDTPANFFARPSPSARFWPSGDPLLQITLARSFLRETTVLFFWTTSARFDLRETFITILTIFLAVYFCLVPTVLSKYSVLWEHIVFCFRVVSSFVCIDLILEWTIPHSFLFRCSMFFCMYSFDKFSPSLIGSRPRMEKLHSDRPRTADM